MNTKLIAVPVAWEISRESAFLAQQTGQLEQIKKERSDEQAASMNELDEALANGYTLLTSHVFAGAGRTLLVFVLRKSSDGIPF